MDMRDLDKDSADDDFRQAASTVDDESGQGFVTGENHHVSPEKADVYRSQ